MNYKDFMVVYPNHPIEGIYFLDWMPLLNDQNAFRQLINNMCDFIYPEVTSSTKIASIESRGFMLGIPMAYQLGIPFIPIRKAGKLPGSVISEQSSSEYEEGYRIEVQELAIKDTGHVLFVDDLLATGKTVKSVIKLFTDHNIAVTCRFFLKLNWVQQIPDLGFSGNEYLLNVNYEPEATLTI